MDANSLSLSGNRCKGLCLGGKNTPSLFFITPVSCDAERVVTRIVLHMETILARILLTGVTHGL